MTTPRSVFPDVLALFNECYRLRIVHKQEIAIEIHPGCIHSVHLVEILEVVVGRNSDVNKRFPRRDVLVPAEKDLSSSVNVQI